MPRRKRSVFVALACAALVLLAGCVPSSTGSVNDWAFFYPSLDSALASTQAIVRGTVVGAEPVSDDGISYVTATVETRAVLAGNIGESAIPVQQFGAESPDPGIPHLEVGETYVLFLEHFNFESYQPCNADAGMYSVAAWGAWKQRDDGTYAWLSNSPDELPVGGYPTVLNESEVNGLADRWASARATATPEDLCS